MPDAPAFQTTAPVLARSTRSVRPAGYRATLATIRKALAAIARSPGTPTTAERCRARRPALWRHHTDDRCPQPDRRVATRLPEHDRGVYAGAPLLRSSFPRSADRGPL